jgi:hypothetical protein
MRRSAGSVAALGLSLAHALAAQAHDQSGGLGAAASATDLYQVTCSNDGSGAPTSLRVQVRDLAPVAAPTLSVQVHANGLLANSSDPVDADASASASPAISVNGGEGPYDVLVDKSAAGSETYTLTFHCQTGPDGGGVHTGTVHSVKQNQ